MANTTLNFSQSNGNRKTFTWSSWVKKNGLSSGQNIFHVNNAGDYSYLMFLNNDKLQYYVQDGATNQIDYGSNQVFRDTSAWYHIVLAVDTTQATSSDRVKIYVNNEQITSWSTASAPSQNADLEINLSGHTFRIGSYNNGGDYFNGSMSHINFIDGTAYDATAFGEYDANGVWKIKTSPSVTYGTNGFFILKDGNSVTDQSGNSNNFTVGGGTLTNTEDSPSNVFATMNPLNYTSPSITYSNGNTKITNGIAWTASLATLGISSGKYYWEGKVVSANNQNLFYGICIANVDLDSAPQNKSGVISQHINGDRYVDTVYTGSVAEALTNGDILGVALDLDSATKTVKFYKNGALLTSSSSINLTSTFDNEFVFPMFIGTSEYANASWETNFGNGYFGTTAVASAGTNASGNGIFEYDVPTGYTALSTKGLNL
jgi:hypothetical protein